jgi:hypothetical protein
MSNESESEPDPIDNRDDELDGLRIRQLASLRRAAYRSRSHAIVAMLVCAVAMVQAAIFLVQHLMHIGFNWRALLYACILIAGAFGSIFFMSRAIALHREATQTHTPAPTTPPDFSSLSDGSQRWKNLEDLQ